MYVHSEMAAATYRLISLPVGITHSLARLSLIIIAHLCRLILVLHIA